MNNFLSSKLAGLQPYVAGEQPKDQKYIKLNTNENPYPPSPKVGEAIHSMDADSLRLYPDPEATDIKHAVGKFFNINAKNVFAGNSSDEILAMAFMAFFMNDKPLIFPNITYSFYPVYSDLYSIDTIKVPLTDDFSIDFDAFPKENGGIIFPNPNAPTGKDIPLNIIEQVIKNNPNSVVIVDEAYVDFGAESAVPLVEKYNNVLVVQTMSKSRSLAGLRVGYAIGSVGLIECLVTVKNSFNSYTLDRVSIPAAVAAMEDVEYFNQCNKKIINTRIRITKELEDIGFKVIPSCANFIFTSPDTVYDAEKLYLDLKAKGILIRYWNKPKINKWCRITIGTDEEMNILIKNIKELL